MQKILVFDLGVFFFFSLSVLSAAKYRFRCKILWFLLACLFSWCKKI